MLSAVLPSHYRSDPFSKGALLVLVATYPHTTQLPAAASEHSTQRTAHRALAGSRQDSAAGHTTSRQLFAVTVVHVPLVGVKQSGAL
jgi:hypothetical protein